MTAIKVVLLLFLVFLVASCEEGGESKKTTVTDNGHSNANSSREATVTDSFEPTQPVMVTRDDPSLPVGCRPREVAGLITNFFQAFNSGDQDRLSRFFDPVEPDEPQPPVLYAAYISKEKGFGTRNEDELLDYFAERHEQKERLELLKVDVGGSWRPNSAGIGFVVLRGAEDLTASLGSTEQIYSGKGGINCKEQTFYLWNMSTESLQKNDRSVPLGPCDEPPGWKARRSILACAR